MSRKWFAKAMVAVVALGLLAGCGGKKETPAPATTPSTPAAPPAFKVGMSTDIGGLNDDSFNAAAWAGLQKAKTDLKAEVQAVESKRAEDYEVNFRTLKDQKYDLIWGIGFLMHDAVANVAKENPTQKYAIIDSEVAGAANVASVLFKEQEGSFLMGIIAAKTTKTKVVGFVGGMEGDVIGRFDAGFQAGVRAIDPSIKIIRVYTASFTDPVKGKSDALSIYSQGADVIFHASGACGQGVIEAAKEKNLYVIGVDSDQNKLAPNNVISSMMKRVDTAVFTISKAAKDGSFPGGKTTVLGLKEDGVGYSSTTLWDKAIPAGTKALVDKWAQAIKDGKVVVPADLKSVEGWKAPTL